jgi:hypothetical protein
MHEMYLKMGFFGPVWNGREILAKTLETITSSLHPAFIGRVLYLSQLEGVFPHVFPDSMTALSL